MGLHRRAFLSKRCSQLTLRHDATVRGHKEAQNTKLTRCEFRFAPAYGYTVMVEVHNEGPDRVPALIRFGAIALPRQLHESQPKFSRRVWADQYIHVRGPCANQDLKISFQVPECRVIHHDKERRDWLQLRQRL